MNTLIAGRRYMHFFYPAVVTPDDDIVKMFERGEIVFNSDPPTHNTIETSARYGHTIELHEHEQTHIISVTDIRDDVWLAHQTKENTRG